MGFPRHQMDFELDRGSDTASELEYRAHPVLRVSKSVSLSEQYRNSGRIREAAVGRNEL
jgi:hypothetical protein